MEIYDDLSEETKQYKDGLVVLGNFDGVHLGHRKLIKKCVLEAKDKNKKSILYTFLNHPVQVLFPEKFEGYINSKNIKKVLLKETGIDILLNRKFTKQFSLLTSEEFIQELVCFLEPTKIFVGFNYSFGNLGQGNLKTLRLLGKKYKFEIYEEPPVYHANLPISSTRIRKYLEIGDIKHAKDMLGYWPIIDGKIISGDRRGRELGFPTANLMPDKNIIIPQTGVYATYACIGGRRYKAITNIGYKPTFLGNSLTIETHILNFSGDLYGTNLMVAFVQKLRDEKKFTSVGELLQQIELDIKIAEQILNKVF